MEAHTLGLLFLAVSNQLQLPNGLLKAICWVESAHKVGAINQTDKGGPSLGLCQVKLETARELGFRGTAYQLQHDPIVNAFMAGRYLRKQMDRYDGNAIKAIASYNAGSFRVDRRGLILNRKYVYKVYVAWQNEELN